jgi:hypothetical protein
VRISRSSATAPDIGTGKTILSSFIIEHLQRESNVTVPYYFCNHRMTGKDTVSNILCTLTLQILQKNTDMIPLVHMNYYEKGTGKAVRTMKNVLKDILAGVSCTRIVIDGLDECDESAQRDLSRALTDVREATGNSVKVLICSRLATDRKATILLRGKTDGAIELYVKHEIAQLRRDVYFVVNNNDAAWVENKLISKADGR